MHAFMQFYPILTPNIVESQAQKNVQNLSHFNENMTNVCNIFLNFYFCSIKAFSKLNDKDALIIISLNAYSGLALPPVPEKKIFMVFIIYGHGGHLGHVTWTIYINFRSPFLRMLHMKFVFDWPRGFRREDL